MYTIYILDPRSTVFQEKIGAIPTRKKKCMHILGNMRCHLTCHTCQSLLIGPQPVAASQLDNKNCKSAFKFSWYAVQYTMKCVNDEAKIYSLNFHWKPGYYTCLLTPNPPLPITWVYRLIKLHRQPTVVPQFVMTID